MMNATVAIGRLLAFCVAVGVGCLCQLLLWRHPGGSLAEALLTHPALWIVYVVAGVLAGEHFLRLVS
jgi:hypothetical protein